MEWNRKEIYRYLGYGRQQPDERVCKTVEEMIILLEKTAKPKNIWRIFPLNLSSEEDIDFSCFHAVSKNLFKNLKGCTQAVLFAATLGIEVDRLLQRYTRLEMSKAVILQASAASMIESYCDQVNEEIREYALKEGYYLHPRFSPGYGDFKIDHQKEIIGVLECPKKIGLTLTDSYIMLPSKSVTAVIGMDRTALNCPKHGCDTCELKNCAYRRG